MSDYEKDTWYREGDLLFILEHAGWSKGKEELRNRVMVRIEARKDVPKEEAEALTAMIHDVLKAHKALRDRALLGEAQEPKISEAETRIADPFRAINTSGITR